MLHGGDIIMLVSDMKIISPLFETTEYPQNKLSFQEDNITFGIFILKIRTDIRNYKINKKKSRANALNYR